MGRTDPGSPGVLKLALPKRRACCRLALPFVVQMFVYPAEAVSGRARKSVQNAAACRTDSAPWLDLPRD